MKTLLYVFLGFILGIILMSVFLMKATYSIDYDRSLGQLDLYLQLDSLQKQGYSEELMETHDNLICYKLDWINTISETIWISETRNDENAELINSAHKRCKDVQLTHPVIKKPPSF